jgi:16S rRNA processing protein RimM
LFGDGSRFEVESVWWHQDRLVFKFHGIDSISEAEPLAGAEVRIPAGERWALEPGEYYESDLIGCEVIDRASGNPLGRVVEWQDSGGPGLLVLEGGLLVPFARAICVEIDTRARRILVDLPEGLKELNRA